MSQGIKNALYFVVVSIATAALYIGASKLDAANPRHDRVAVMLGYGDLEHKTFAVHFGRDLNTEQQDLGVAIAHDVAGSPARFINNHTLLVESEQKPCAVVEFTQRIALRFRTEAGFEVNDEVLANSLRFSPIVGASDLVVYCSN